MVKRVTEPITKAIRECLLCPPDERRKYFLILEQLFCEAARDPNDDWLYHLDVVKGKIYYETKIKPYEG